MNQRTSPQPDSCPATSHEVHSSYFPYQARYDVPGSPYLCSLCYLGFSSLDRLKQHFNTTCFPLHSSSLTGTPTDTTFDAHPSALSAEQALLLPNARPSYPVWQAQYKGQTTLLWPVLIGWPMDPVELERKNAAHRAIEGNNRRYVDTPGNVYADVPGDADKFVSGERPVMQLRALICLVVPHNVKEILRYARDGRWKHGYGDDVFLAIALHKSDEDLETILQISKKDRAEWLDQAIENFSYVHTRVSGPGNVGHGFATGEEQDRAFGELIGNFRRAHVGIDGRSKVMSCCRGDLVGRTFAELDGEDAAPVA